MSERQYDIGYFSSADRGLDTLLEMIPEIEKQLGRPVKSVWPYGWNHFDAFHAKNTDKMKWKWNVIRKMSDVGMESKGRLNHQDLADLMKDTTVWAYPTEFTEIHCITALKAQEAGCIPVTTNVGALNETVKNGILIDCLDISTNKAKQAEFVKAVVDLLNGKGPVSDNKIKDRYWPDVAKVWDKVLA